jgi:hypothetical protein
MVAPFAVGQLAKMMRWAPLWPVAGRVTCHRSKSLTKAIKAAQVTVAAASGRRLSSSGGRMNVLDQLLQGLRRRVQFLLDAGDEGGYRRDPGRPGAAFDLGRCKREPLRA